jgi:hypothetical protein
VNEREYAIKLRTQGKTYSEIRKELGKRISKSTLSYWCRGVLLKNVQKDRIRTIQIKNIKIAQNKALIINKKKREEYLEALKKRHEHLKKIIPNINISRLLLAMLYLGEGAKWKSHRGLQLGSSNPEIMKIYLNLLEKCFGVSRENLKGMIFHRADQNLNSLISYWSKTLGISQNNFYKSKPDMRTKNRKTRSEYHGVCAVFGPNTEIQLELQIIASFFSEIGTK